MKELQLIEKHHHNESQQKGTSKTLAGWEHAHRVNEEYAHRSYSDRRNRQEGFHSLRF